VATGAIAEQIDYDEFRCRPGGHHPGFQPFAFAGGLYDSQTRLTRFGARDSTPRPDDGRQKIPVLLGGGHSNFYVYALSDPINRLDVDWAAGATSCGHRK